MSNEIYAGLKKRTGGELTLAAVGAPGVGKSAFVRVFAKNVFGKEAQEGEVCSAGGAVPAGDGSLDLSVRECAVAEALRMTAAVVVVTDGSFGDSRDASVKAEEGIVQGLKQGGKPYILVVNSAAPQSEECRSLCGALGEKYGAPVVAENLLSGCDARVLLETLLHGFPVKRLDFYFPEWLRVLPCESAMVSELLAHIRGVAPEVVRMSDASKISDVFADGDVYCETCETDEGAGVVTCRLAAKDGMFYKVLSEECGVAITDDLRLMAYVRALGDAKSFYDRYGAAFRRAEESGYGVSVPNESDMKLCPPELYRRGARSGVKLRAEACTYHVIKVNVSSEVSPIAGEAARGEEIAKGMVDSYEKDPEGLWNTDMFGKTFKEMARDGLLEKTVPEDARGKLRRAVTRIVNEGKGGVICILL